MLYAVAQAVAEGPPRQVQSHEAFESGDSFEPLKGIDDPVELAKCLAM